MQRKVQAGGGGGAPRPASPARAATPTPAGPAPPAPPTPPPQNPALRAPPRYAAHHYTLPPARPGVALLTP